MAIDFFEGKDFNKEEFRPLNPKYYPKVYQDYIKEETEIVQKIVKGSDRILDVGVGTGRMVPLYAPLVKEYIGIDNAKYMISQANKVAQQFSNVKILKEDIESLNKKFTKHYFDYSLILWNTLGNVKNEVVALNNLKEITKKSILVTTFHRGHWDKRKEWYKSVGIELDHVDEKTETVYSKSGLLSRSYQLDNFKRFAKEIGLRLKQHKLLSDVCIFVEFELGE